LGGGLSANPHNTRDHKEFAQPRLEPWVARMHPQRHICVRNKLIHKRANRARRRTEMKKLPKESCAAAMPVKRCLLAQRSESHHQPIGPGWCEIAPTDTRRRREDSQPISEKSSKLHKFVKWPQSWGGNRMAALDPVGWSRVDSLINYGDETRLASSRSAALTAPESPTHC
jgi:hypothetical protein